MAGRPGNAAEIVRLNAELNELRDERDRYRRLLISIDPSYVDDERPPPVEAYSPDILPRVLAMGDMGMGEEQWVGEFGISRKIWAGWKAQFPELNDTVEVGLSRALSWWQEQARQAQEKGNNKFPISVYNTRTAEIRDALVEIADNGSQGDASQLVLLDLRESAPVS